MCPHSSKAKLFTSTLFVGVNLHLPPPLPFCSPPPPFPVIHDWSLRKRTLPWWDYLKSSGSRCSTYMAWDRQSPHTSRRRRQQVRAHTTTMDIVLTNTTKSMFNTSIGNTSDRDNMEPPGLSALSYISIGTVGVLTSVFNAVLVIVLFKLKSRHLHPSTRYFLINESACRSCLGLVILFIMFTRSGTSASYKITAVFFASLVLNGQQLLGVDSYLAIVWPLKYKRLMASRRAKLALLTTTAFWTLCLLTLVLANCTEGKEDPNLNGSDHSPQAFVFICGTMLVTLLLTLVLYAWAIWKLNARVLKPQNTPNATEMTAVTGTSEGVVHPLGGVTNKILVHPKGDALNNGLVHPHGDATKNRLLHPHGDATNNELVHPHWKATNNGLVHPQGKATNNGLVHPQGKATNNELVHPHWKATNNGLVHPHGNDRNNGLVHPHWKATNNRFLHPPSDATNNGLVHSQGGATNIGRVHSQVAGTHATSTGRNSLPTRQGRLVRLLTGSLLVSLICWPQLIITTMLGAMYNMYDMDKTRLEYYRLTLAPLIVVDGFVQPILAVCLSSELRNGVRRLFCKRNTVVPM